MVRAGVADPFFGVGCNLWSYLAQLFCPCLGPRQHPCRNLLGHHYPQRFQNFLPHYEASLVIGLLSSQKNSFAIRPDVLAR